MASYTKMNYSPRVQKLTIPKGHRVIIISDIHGKLSYLKGLLDKLVFTKNDYLLIAGDLVEKGGDSLATIRYLMELSKTHPVYPVYGNVDAKAVDYLASSEEFERRYRSMMKNWGNSFYGELMEEQGITLEDLGGRSPQAIEMERMAQEKAEAQERKRLKKVSAETAVADIRSHYTEELDYIRSLPVILDTGAFLVTHAGLPSEDYEAFTPEMVKKMIKWDSFLEADVSFSRYVFVGHWPLTIYEREQMDSSPIIDRKKKIVGLDGGCAVKRDGQLNAVILPEADSEEFEIVSYDNFPKITVLEDQAEGKDAFYVRWDNRFVELLEKGKEASLVRFKLSKEEHWLPNMYLWEEEEGLCCSDYTDYRMPLQAGEEVSLLCKFQNSCLVRKNGIIGWYDGIYNYI